VEQEYFLVDKALYQLRPDLVLTGRTLFGYAAAKNQQLDDHYFGSIPDRVFNYMYEMEMEAHKLGIPLRTRHNEVAPGQYECAPQFEEINLAVDHNQLLMDLMDEVADRHGFKVLLHEKPFAGINGSGKHNNWSLGTDTGVNLLSPGDNPQSSLSFLTFFINTIKAVHDHADLIRASIASAGNDHRLGANEAPPAIISIFIGSTLTEVLDNIEKGIEGKSDSGKSINIAQIPEILVDNTDRNRTSPFAFTGNKFELRAVGSTTNCASPMTVLNAAMANQLKEFKTKVDALISSGKGKEEAILTTLRSELKASKRILFEGNGYGEEWVIEAEKRGLSNIKETPEALKAYISESTVDLMSKLNVLTEEELEARYDITLEAYHKCIQIEGRVIDEMAYTHVVPAAMKYQKIVAEAVERQLSIGIAKKDLKPALDLLDRLNGHLNAFTKNVHDMVDARRKANKQEDNAAIARHYAREVRSYFDEIRYHADKMERLIDDDLWELPKYRELLFIK
jgi:glutamine synthetase